VASLNRRTSQACQAASPALRHHAQATGRHLGPPPLHPASELTSHTDSCLSASHVSLQTPYLHSTFVHLPLVRSLVMTVVKFCDPCQAFLRGERTEDGEQDLPSGIRYVHHNTAESFRLALELPCAICIRLWAAILRPYKKTTSENGFQAQILPASPTTILVTTDDMGYPNYFKYQRDQVEFELRPETGERLGCTSDHLC
jgi:hypothetical protein